MFDESQEEHFFVVVVGKDDENREVFEDPFMAVDAARKKQSEGLEVTLRVAYEEGDLMSYKDFDLPAIS